MRARAPRKVAENVANRSGADARTAASRLSVNEMQSRSSSIETAPPLPDSSSCRSSAVRSDKSCGVCDDTPSKRAHKTPSVATDKTEEASVVQAE